MDYFNKINIIFILIVIILLTIFYNYRINKDNKNYKKLVIYPNYYKTGNDYFYGNEIIEPDYDKALENYYKVLIYEPDNEDIKNIRQNINTIITDNNILDENQIIINNRDFGILNDINDYIIDIDIDAIELLDPENPPLILNTENANQEYYNDLQNVHDSIVNKTINTSIKKLEDNTEMKYDLNNINAYLLQNLKNYDFTNTDKEKILKTIDYISQNSTLSIGNRQLSDNLLLVGNRIMSKTNKEQKDLINNLYQELRDCNKNNNEMFCTTGIANRIINSINGIDPLVIITPKWAIREEQMGKCAKIREDLEKNKSMDDIDFDEVLKEKIKTELFDEYVAKNKILSEDDFYKEINNWIDFI